MDVLLSSETYVLSIVLNIGGLLSSKAYVLFNKLSSNMDALLYSETRLLVFGRYFRL